MPGLGTVFFAFVPVTAVTVMKLPSGSSGSQVQEPLATGERARNWRFDPAIAGAGLFLDLGSHCVDLLDFLVGRIETVSGFAINTGHAYAVEDVDSKGSRVGGRPSVVEDVLAGLQAILVAENELQELILSRRQRYACSPAGGQLYRHAMTGSGSPLTRIALALSGLVP